MNDYLVDTNHLATIFTPDHPVKNRIERQIRYGDTFSVAVPSLTEMLYGVLVLPRAKENLAEWQARRVMFNFYEIDTDDAEDAAKLQVRMRFSGEQLGTVDALIATVALTYRLTLLTTDHDFDKIENLSTENWFE